MCEITPLSSKCVHSNFYKKTQRSHFKQEFENAPNIRSTLFPALCKIILMFV